MVVRSKEEVLAACGLFSGLDARQRGVLEKLGQRVHFETQQTIFRQDEPCPGLYVVDRGLVRVFRLAPSGQEHVLHLCGPNQTFAEVAAIGDFPVPANAQAAAATTCVLLPAPLLQRELHRNHELCRQMLVGMSFWVRHLVQLLEDLALRDADGRVARLLGDLEAGPDGRVTLPSTKKDLASHLNLSSETFSRVLRRLGERGLIDLAPETGLRVLDAVGLRALAQR